MTTKDIQKYRNKSLSQLKALATKHFNAYIRKRDENCNCISCNLPKVLEAGHYFSADKYSILRYHEHNTNGECHVCNCYVENHLENYKVILIMKIGADEFIELERLADESKKTSFKWSKIDLIETIIKYKKKIKEL